MIFAVIREAAESASTGAGPLHGYPPWLIVLVGALGLAVVVWLFTKLLKIALWIAIVGVLVGGAILAGKMFFGQ